MNNLYYYNEYFTHGYISNVLDIISLIAILCGILIIINKNPIVSLLFLIGLFGSIASYLIISGIAFIGISYLVVYIGAISILFLFILMLINIRVSEIQSDTSNSILLSIIVTIVFNYILFQSLPYNIAILNNINSYINAILYKTSLYNTEITNFKNDLFFVSSKMWDGNLEENNHIVSIGNVMYTNYNIWLILSAIILLLAMVGAIVITIKQKN